MTTDTDTLEHLLTHHNDQPPTCESPRPHRCTHVARWACYASAKCRQISASPGGRMLWCDSRKKQFDQLVTQGARCACLTGPLGHSTTVVPL